MPLETDEHRQRAAEALKKLCSSIKQNVLFAAAHCLDDINEPEDEILYGSAGFMQPLLLLKSELKRVVPVIEAIAIDDINAKWQDLN